MARPPSGHCKQIKALRACFSAFWLDILLPGVCFSSGLNMHKTPWSQPPLECHASSPFSGIPAPIVRLPPRCSGSITTSCSGAPPIVGLPENSSHLPRLSGVAEPIGRLPGSSGHQAQPDRDHYLFMTVADVAAPAKRSVKFPDMVTITILAGMW